MCPCQAINDLPVWCQSASMAFSVGELFSTAFTILATSLALAAIFENSHLKSEVRGLDKLVATLREEVGGLLDAGAAPSEAQAFPLRGNASRNTFYAGTGTRIQLDQPIFGAPGVGELDAYDSVYPSVLAYGTMAVRGTGRLVLDGDASDVVLKIDNTYFSLRELFGFGSTLNYDPAPQPSPPPDAPRALELCTDTDLLAFADRPSDRSNCIYRRNWGVDACFSPDDGAPYNPPEPICICGGGWNTYSRVVRVRHFVRKTGSSSTTTSGFTSTFFENAAACCSPHASAAACSLTNFAWLDTMLRCENTEDRLCDAKDRSDYLGFYTGGFNATDARAKVNTHGWSATRDYRFDDGQWYALQLTADVERACTGLRLSLVHSHAYTIGFPAAFVCGKGARIWFEVAPTENYESHKRGSEYYALTHEPSHSGWFCLSAELNETSVEHYVGEAASFQADQLAWLPYPQARTLCQKLYLGFRELYGFVQGGVKIGIYTDKENNYARAAENVEMAILPYE